MKNSENTSITSKFINDFNDKRRKKKTSVLVCSVLAVMVAAATVIEMILPAQAVTQTQMVLDCSFVVHEHTDECYRILYDEEGNETGKELICGQADYVVHTHTEECYKTYVREDGSEEKILVCELPEIEEHVHDESCYDEEGILICDQPELHKHDESCYDEEGNLICGQMELLKHEHTDACFREEEIAEEVMPPQDFFGETEELTVSVSAPEGAFPENTTMNVRMIEDDSVLGAAADAAENQDSIVTKVLAADISFTDAEGNEIEPAAAIQVVLTPKERLPLKDEKTSVYHIDDEGSAAPVDLNEEETTDTAVVFDAETFSVYAIVYTVDYSYEVNGNVYRYSMDGADSASLRELIEILHLFENDPEYDDTDSFMAGVENVEFSDPELLLPVKVEENSEVGRIKSGLGLYPVYPLGLTEQEVLALNAKEYFAGDWVLISLKPFDSREELTITMADGKDYVITITDAQDAPMNGDVVQTIPNPAGTTIDLFDYWVVSQELVGRDGWGDLNQNQGADEAGDDRPLNGTGNNKGINSSTYDENHGHALKFTPAWSGTVYNGSKTGTTGNEWQSVNLDGRNGLNSYTGSGNPFMGIVQDTLVDGYPVLSDNSTIGATGESLDYLFDPTASHSGKASYSDVNQLLYVDKDGYYTFDSRDYAAEFDPSTSTFTVTEQTSSNSEIRGFWPFGTQNFWSGMHLNTQFSMPQGGRVLNPVGVYKPMQFEFSGDDDTWLYIDGVLVGDGGGIHNRTEIDINFEEGTVLITGRNDANHAGTYEEVLYLDDIFKDAGRYPEEGSDEELAEWEDIGDGSGHKRFKAGTYHTFDMFYLERGGGESNLYIHYNLVSTADFTAHKAYYGEDQNDPLERDQFQFELIGLDGKYHSVFNPETNAYELVQADETSRAIMPAEPENEGDGTVAAPSYDGETTTDLSDGTTVSSQTYTTGTTEDGNINFGFAVISENDMNEADNGNAPVYRYIIREIVPDDAVNADGVTWAEATDEQKEAGGFTKDQIAYDGKVYYMTGRVTSWTETSPSGQEYIRHGIAKTYYTDDTFTTVESDTTFAGFENRFQPDFGDLEFKKTDENDDPLGGAVFALYKDEECTIPLLNLDAENTPAWTATADGNGKVLFENVRIGTYYMKEIEAPSGYALDETVYQVVIEDKKDHEKTTKITINGDETETAVTEIANAKPGEFSAVKQWLNPRGSVTDGGDRTVTVQVKRRYQEPHQTAGVHTVTVQMSVEDNGQQNGTPTTQELTGDTIVIEWDDEWQRNFNWSLTVGSRQYEGWIGDEFVQGDGYKFEQIANDGRSRRLTIYDVDGDVTFTTKYWVNWLHSDPNHWNNLNNPMITATGGSVIYTQEEDTEFNDENHTQTLSGPDWSHTWTVGGTESSHSGYDFPAKDDDGQNYLYYICELDEQGNPVEIGGEQSEGVILYGYSANNNTGVSNQGVITVYNQLEGPDTIDLVIKKTDDAENSTNFLEDAVFKLEYRENEGEVFTAVSADMVAELDENSQFTVPEEGITLTGLPDGQYRIQEISPPVGYVIVEQYPVLFTVSNGVISSTEGTIDAVRYTAAGETTDAEFIIPNTPGAELPYTGGSGTYPYLIFGSILIFAACVLLVKRQRAAE